MDPTHTHGLEFTASRYGSESIRRASHHVQGPDSDDEDQVPEIAINKAHTISVPDSKIKVVAADNHTFKEEVDSPLILLPSTAGDDVIVISDPLLESIGEQLQDLEDEVVLLEETKWQDWRKNDAPAMKQLIENLEEKIESYRSRLSKEKTRGGEHISLMEEKIQEKLLLRDETKLMYHFPQSKTSFGQDGLYMAFDDLWIENISGKFEIEISPSMGSGVGKIIFLLTGKGSSNKGVTVKLRMCNFKLYSDSIAVPSLSFEFLTIEAILSVTIVFSFLTEERKWLSPSEDFLVSLIDFSGPFALTRGVVSTILSIAVPIIRDELLKELPMELGVLISDIPLPFVLNGSFDISGPLPIDAIFSKMFLSPEVCQLMNYNPNQLLNFVGIQKSMKRKKPLESVADLLQYNRLYSSHEHWSNIKALWDEAALVYFSKTVQHSNGTPTIIKSRSKQDFNSFLQFDKLMLSVAEVMKRPVIVDLDLQSIEGQIGLKSVVSCLISYILRLTEEVTHSADGHVSASQKEIIRDLQGQLGALTDNFHLILKSLDHIHQKIHMRIQTGPDAELELILEGISAQAPLAIWTTLPKEHVIALDQFIVPTLVAIKTSHEGIINVRMFQMSCPEMMLRKNFERFFDEYNKCSSKVERNLKRSCSGIALFEAAGSELLKMLVAEDMDDYKIESQEKKTIDEAHLGWLRMGTELVSCDIIRPMLSLILDKPTSLAAGASLLTIQVGPLDPSWRPSGADPTEDTGYLADIQSVPEMCPILIQSSNQVKVLAKIPRVTVSIRLMKSIQYLMDHFEDIEKLFAVFSSAGLTNREASLKYINLAMLFLVFCKKNVGQPNFDLQLFLSVSVIAHKDDVIMCIENRNQDESALQARARVEILELINDSKDLKKFFLECFD